MAALAVDRRERIQVMQLSVDPDPAVPLCPNFLQKLPVFALAVSNQRSEEHGPRTLPQAEYAVHHLGDRLGLDGKTGGRRICNSRAGKEKSEVVVDFGYRRDGRPGISGGRLLLDGYRRRQSLDSVHIGLLHGLEKLPGVGGEGFDVSSLPLRVDRVKRKRGFSGTRESGDDDQLIARDIHVNAAEVVLPRSANFDGPRWWHRFIPELWRFAAVYHTAGPAESGYPIRPINHGRMQRSTCGARMAHRIRFWQQSHFARQKESTMSGSVNKAIIVGNLGADPEIRQTRDGRAVANLRVATNETWKDRNTGERNERTEWHRVAIFNEGLVRVVENFLQKGSKVYIEGQDPDSEVAGS